jgi:hypothetical protein
MNLRQVQPNAVQFASSKDHSKYALAADANTPYVCVGDINRQVERTAVYNIDKLGCDNFQTSQERRSGGTMCLSNVRVWQSYRSAVDEVEPCPVAGVGVVHTSTTKSAHTIVTDVLLGFTLSWSIMYWTYSNGCL